MATLKDLKPSLTELSKSSLMELIRSTRKARLSPVEKQSESLSLFKLTSKLNAEEAQELLDLIAEESQ